MSTRTISEGSLQVNFIKAMLTEGTKEVDPLTITVPSPITIIGPSYNGVLSQLPRVIRK